jgi:hypothetical protein
MTSTGKDYTSNTNRDNRQFSPRWVAGIRDLIRPEMHFSFLKDEIVYSISPSVFFSVPVTCSKKRRVKS